mmetsp:Transcript_25505/g.61321  ORF Transcript_25505/g.61321 Transcript_25505/m.61321 type:complete len:200 (+) Transcript_25505:869-1468(+)
MVQIHRVKRLVDADHAVRAAGREAQSQVAGREFDGGHGPPRVGQRRLIHPSGCAPSSRLPRSAGVRVSIQEAVGAAFGCGQGFESSLPLLPYDDCMVGPGSGDQLSELRMRPADPVHRTSMRLPLVGIIGPAPAAATRRRRPQRIARPRPVRIQIPHPHGPIAARGCESTSIVIEGHVEDVVEVAVGEERRGRVGSVGG